MQQESKGRLAEPLSPDQHIDTKAAAALCGLTPGYLQELRVRGNGPHFVKFSAKAVRYRVRDLLDWADACRVRSTSELEAA